MKIVIDDGTIRFYFTSNAAAGNPVAPSAAFVAADFAIYKDGSATQKSTTNGLTVTSPFDAIAGLHLLEIDCSDDTGDAGFWAVGSTYEVRLSTATTVDSLSVNGYGIGEFRIQAKADLDDLNDFNPSTDTVANVTTVATTTTNSDMRGTDSALLASSAPANFSSLLINSSGHVSRVTLVDTTTVNSDMRGTDGAATSAQATTISSQISGLNDLSSTDINNEVVDVINVDTLVAGQTVAEALRRIGAITSGKVSGAGSGSEVFKDYEDSVNTITITVDTAGNRTAVSY